MADKTDWTMVRIPRQLRERLAEIARRREAARQNGFPIHDCEDEEPVHAVIAYLVKTWFDHAARRKK